MAIWSGLLSKAKSAADGSVDRELSRDGFKKNGSPSFTTGFGGTEPFNKIPMMNGSGAGPQNAAFGDVARFLSSKGIVTAAGLNSLSDSDWAALQDEYTAMVGPDNPAASGQADWAQIFAGMMSQVTPQTPPKMQELKGDKASLTELLAQVAAMEKSSNNRPRRAPIPSYGLLGARRESRPGLLQKSGDRQEPKRKISRGIL